MPNTADMTPAEIDTELDRLYAAALKMKARITAAHDLIHHEAGDRKSYTRGNRREWTMTLDDATARCREIAADETAPAYKRNGAQAALDKLTDRLAELAAIETEAAPFEAEFDARRWSRFFMVVDGHIHSSMRCHSCRPTTEFGWLPALAGATEAEAVAAHGALLCTHCYPTAPVEWTNGREVEAAAKRAAQCPGSGKRMKAGQDYDPHAYRRYATCPDCGGIQSVTDMGKLRAHKPPKGK